LIEQRVVEVAVQRRNGSAESQDRDLLAIEEPLESRLGYGTAEGRRSRRITVTMRTPGSDSERLGFLHGVVNLFALMQYQSKGEAVCPLLPLRRPGLGL
jgi:hypothetical protein